MIDNVNKVTGTRCAYIGEGNVCPKLNYDEDCPKLEKFEKACLSMASTAGKLIDLEKPTLTDKPEELDVSIGEVMSASMAITSCYQEEVGE